MLIPGCLAEAVLDLLQKLAASNRSEIDKAQMIVHFGEKGGAWPKMATRHGLLTLEDNLLQ